MQLRVAEIDQDLTIESLDLEGQPDVHSWTSSHQRKPEGTSVSGEWVCIPISVVASALAGPIDPRRRLTPGPRHLRTTPLVAVVIFGDGIGQDHVHFLREEEAVE